MSGEGEDVEGADISTGPKEKWNHVRVANGVELHLRHGPAQVQAGGVAAGLELLESLAVTEPQKIAPPQEIAFAPAAPETVRPGSGSEGVCS